MTTWNAETAADEKHPVYYMLFDGSATRYSGGRMKAPGGTVKVYLKSIGGVSQKIEFLDGKATIGGIRISLLDVDGEITDIVSTEKVAPIFDTLINRKMTFFGGYAPLDEADYQQIFVGQNTGWNYDVNKKEYRFEVSDIKRATLDEINLDTTEAASTTIEGNPIDIYRAYMTGDFANGGFPVITSGTTPTGLDVSTEFIDDTELASERDDWLWYWYMKFNFLAPEKGKDFFEQEIFKIFGYPKILSTGKIAARRYRPAHPALPPLTLDENDIVSLSALKRLYKDHLTSVKIWGDYNAVTDEFESLLFSFLDTADQTKTQEKPDLEIFSRGLRTEYDGVRTARFATNRWLQRYITPPLELKASVLFKKRALEVGDVVKVSHPELPNLTDGTLGWVDEPCEVTRVVIDFAKGLVNLTLLTTNFGKRYRVIAPNSLVDDHGDQTQEERDKYLSIADTITEDFLNGELAHQIM